MRWKRCRQAVTAMAERAWWRWRVPWEEQREVGEEAMWGLGLGFMESCAAVAEGRSYHLMSTSEMST